MSFKQPRLNSGMIPVSPHGEFAPTIKFLFRVRPKILCSCLRSCHRVIKSFRRIISVYVCLCHLAIRESRHQRTPGRHRAKSTRTKRSHLATKRSFLATSNLIRQWVKERGIISICDSIWLGANSIKLSRCRGELGGGELAMGRNRQLPNSILYEGDSNF